MWAASGAGAGRVRRASRRYHQTNTARKHFDVCQLFASSIFMSYLCFYSFVLVVLIISLGLLVVAVRDCAAAINVTQI